MLLDSGAEERVRLCHVSGLHALDDVVAHLGEQAGLWYVCRLEKSQVVARGQKTGCFPIGEHLVNRDRRCEDLLRVWRRRIYCACVLGVRK